MIQFQIPDDAIDQLRSLLEADGQMQWKIGQFIADYWQEMRKYIHEEEEREQHAELIRQFARGTGADKTTLRDREKMWLFFTDDDRLRYEVFTYHQFRALRSAGEDNWEEYAEWAIEYGASVAEIRRKIKMDKDPVPDWVRRMEALEKQARKIFEDDATPEEVKSGVVLILTILEDTKEIA